MSKIIYSQQYHVQRNTILKLHLSMLTLSLVILITSNYGLHQAQAERFVDSSTLKPSIYIIVPQAFRVPTNADSVDERFKLQQHVALINNAQNDREDQLLRQQYGRLSLQVRDAKSPVTGQLFYEHVFDYFPANQPQLLIPINLEQVSTYQERIVVPSPLAGQARNKYSPSAAGDTEPQAEPPATIIQPQRLIVSIRPHQIDSGFGSENIEFVSSSPILVEPVPSKDGRRSFSFVQTDKPIYKPDEMVRIRALVVNELLRPIIRDEVRLQIRNPHKVVVEEVRFPRPTSAANVSKQGNSFGIGQNGASPQFYFDHNFEFPTEPMLGVWSVHLLHNDPIANDTISFEVKEYTLPPFEIEFNLQQSYILPSTQKVAGHIVAKYHYGKPVQGKAQFKFGIRESLSARPRYIARSTIKTVDPHTGRVDFKLETKKIQETDWFPNLAGWRLVVEVTITEMTTGHRETAHDSSCQFITMPYRISFENSIEDFKPGLNQSLTVQLIDAQSQQPGPAGRRIFAQYHDQNGTLLTVSDSQRANAEGLEVQETLDTEAVTDSLGRASFTIGLLRHNLNTIQITMRSPLNATFAQSNSSLTRSDDRAINEIVGAKNADLAAGHHTLIRHESQNGWISFANKSVTFLHIGAEFVSDLYFRDAIILPRKIFYLIVARGQIVALNPLDSDGFVRFKISEDMMPSIRVVLFALTSDSVGLLSDSMRVNIGHNLDCNLDLQFKPAANLHHQQTDDKTIGALTHRPNTNGTLEVTARPGDLVSIIGVDSAVFSLNNRSRLEPSRVVQRIKRLDTGCGFGGGRDMHDVFHNAGLMIFKELSSMGPGAAHSAHIGTSCLTVVNQLRYLEDAQLGYSKPVFAHLLNRPRALEVAMKMQRHKYGQQLLAGRSRSKREIDVDGILRRYRDPKHRACCRLGTLEDLPQRRDCVVRAKIVEKYMRQDVEHASASLNPCSQIYFDCCRAVYGDPLSMSSIFGRSGLEPLIESRRVTSLQQVPQYSDAVVLPNMGQLDRVEAETLTRRDFRETWLFDLVEIEQSSAAIGTATKSVKLPHSITSWTVSAMALNQNKPMCLMPRPLKLATFQQIFVQLSMPYKVVQGEQIDLVASVFNYSPQTQEVLVYMYGVDDVCSEAEPGERSELKRTRVERHSSQAVLFPMIPLKTGKYPIKIVAVSLRTNHSDIVERQLSVVPRGKPVTDETTFSLDPMNHQRRSKRAIQTGNLVDEIDSARGLQHSKVRLTPTRDSEFIVPQTQECIISAIGDKMGQTVQTTLLDVENLIRLPHGCGEQVMIYLGPTLYTTRYLSSMNKLYGDLRWRAIRYIQSGYKRILNFRKESTGAFSAFSRREPSIWLTAFVAKMLCQTERTPFVSNEIHVDKSVVNSALVWLIESQNKATGTWLELNPVYHREMLGGVLRENVLTAFVVVALNECGHHSADLIGEVRATSARTDADDKTDAEQLDQVSSSTNENHSQSNAVDRLRSATLKAEEALVLDRFKALQEKNPYVLALTAYALSFSQPRESALTLNDLMSLAERSQSRNQLFWRGDYPIETAAYALQTIIELAPIVASPAPAFGSQMNWSPGSDAIAIANWLSSRRSYTGAFESTQDTVVALEALSKFAQLQSTPSGNALIANGNTDSPNLSCNVTVNNRTRRSIGFGKDNAQVLQTFKLDSFDLDLVNGEMIDIITSGNGLGTMSVKLKYNVFQEEDELCRFNIDSSIEEWQPKLAGGVSSTSGGSSLWPNSNANEQQQQEPSGEVTNKPAAPASEDDFFKTFDKSMLNELNLIDNYQHSDAQNDTQQLARNQSSSIAILRLRRAAASETSENWASKMVSSLRSRLPSWIAPKHSTPEVATALPPRLTVSSLAPATTGQSTTATPGNLHHSHGEPQQRTRNNTLRRSTHQLAAPMISTPNGIPVGAHMNSLSSKFDLGSNQTNLNGSLVAAGNNLQPPVSVDSMHRLVLLLRVCVHHISSRRDSEMSVIEIGILSGFKPNEADLNEIIRDAGTPAMKFELSQDKSLVIIYMHYIPFSGPFCLQFRLVRDSFVYNLQSGYIRVYEYYSPTHSCSNFYTPNRVSDLIETNCDSSGQVCQCASKSLCPANKKILELGDIQRENATSARAQLVDLICSPNRFDLVSLVKLKGVRHLEAGKIFKLTVKIKMDIKGNLTKLIDAQRQQRAQLFNTVRKPTQSSPGSDVLATNEQLLVPDSLDNNEQDSASSLDHLTLNIDADCVRNDPLLLHLAHPSQWKQGGETMILFARSDKLEKRHFRVALKTPVSASNQTPVGPKPKAAIIFNNQAPHQADQFTPSPSTLNFQDAQQLQYSLTLPLDKNSILHDISYQAKVGSREAINNLMFWLELRSRREKWTCGPK